MRTFSLGPIVGFGLAFIAFSILCCHLFPWRLIDELRLDWGKPLNAHGRIVSRERIGDDARGSAIYEIFITFETEKGEKIAARCYGYVPRGDQESCKVYYSAARPEAARIWGSTINRYGYRGALAALLPLFIGLALWHLCTNRRRLCHLLREGQHVRGQIVDARRGWDKEPLPFRFIVRLSIDATRRSAEPQDLTFKSTILEERALAESKLKEGSPVHILYDPMRPSRMMLPEWLVGEPAGETDLLTREPRSLPALPQGSKVALFSRGPDQLTLKIPRRGGRPITAQEVLFCLTGVFGAPAGEFAIEGTLGSLPMISFTVVACFLVLSVENVLWERQEIELTPKGVAVTKRRPFFSRMYRVASSEIERVTLADVEPTGFVNRLRYVYAAVKAGQGDFLLPQIELRGKGRLHFAESLSPGEKNWVAEVVAAHVRRTKAFSGNT